MYVAVQSRQGYSQSVGVVCHLLWIYIHHSLNHRPGLRLHLSPPPRQINPLKQTNDAPGGRIAAGLVRLDWPKSPHMQSLSNIGANSQQERWQILAVWEESIAAEDLQPSSPPSRHQCFCSSARSWKIWNGISCSQFAEDKQKVTELQLSLSADVSLQVSRIIHNLAHSWEWAELEQPS